jgi:hypothetical protein
MTLNSLYKRLFLLLLVLGPFFWLVFTEDGQRRTDLVLISLLKDSETMDIAFAKLAESAREDDFRANFPEVDFVCEDKRTHFGDRVCASPIAAFNGTPASSASLYFRDGNLAAAKLVYQRAHQAHLLTQLQRELGLPVRTGDRASDGGVQVWHTSYGSVMVNVAPGESRDEPSVLWLSNRYLHEQGTKG